MTLFGAFICNIVTSVIALGLLLRVHSSAKGKTKGILNWAAITVVLVFGEVLSLWLEEGFHTSTPIMRAFVIASACVWASKVTEVNWD